MNEKKNVKNLSTTEKGQIFLCLGVLGGLVIIGAALRLYQLGINGRANEYYGDTA